MTTGIQEQLLKKRNKQKKRKEGGRLEFGIEVDKRSCDSLHTKVSFTGLFIRTTFYSLIHNTTLVLLNGFHFPQVEPLCTAQ